MKKLTAAILTGGKNSRMNGVFKPDIIINGSSIFSQQFEVLNHIFDEIIVCGTKPKSTESFIVYPDSIANAGPLAGIYTAIKNTKSDYVFVFSADMPFLCNDLIVSMLANYNSSIDFALVSMHNNGIEPLHSIYHKNLLPEIELQLSLNNFKIRNLFKNDKIRFFNVNLQTEAEKIFFNVNTPNDIEIAKNYANKT